MTLLAAAGLMAAASSCQQPAKDNSQAVIDNIMARRSIRKYTSEPVKRETLDQILECGINAPSALNKQSWEVRVINDPAKRAEFLAILLKDNPGKTPEEIEDSWRGAPTLIVVGNDVSFICSQVDCGLLCENIMLSACALGVGSVCLGNPMSLLSNSQEAVDMLGFTPGFKPLICIGLGYGLEAPDAKPRDASKIKFIGE